MHTAQQRLQVALAVVATGLLVPCTVSQAASIGVNFVGNGGTGVTMAPATEAGVVPQPNFNNVTGRSGTGLALADSDTGTAAGDTATLTFNASGTYSVIGGGAIPGAAGGDEQLNGGFVHSSGTGTPITATVSNIPFARYDVYVYALNDNNRNDQFVTLTPAGGGSATTYYLDLRNGGDAGLVDSNAATPYTYQLSTATDLASAGQANYVAFAGLTASEFSLAVGAPGNGALNGFQIVEVVPEPGSLGIIALGGLALLRRRRA